MLFRSQGGQWSPQRCGDRTKALSGRSVCGVPERGTLLWKTMPCCWRRKGEAALVLPGLLGSKGDTKLALKPPKVEVDRRERLDGGMSQCQLSSHHDDEVQVTKAHVCTRDLADSMASHSWPDVNVRTHKGTLPGMPTIGVSSKHQLVNLYYCALGPDGVLKRHKVYTDSGKMSLRPVHGSCSCYLH